MNVNPLREIWKTRAAVGTYVMFSRDITTVQLAAAAGLDFIVFDLEHRPHDAGNLHDMCQVARMANLAPIVGPAQIQAQAVSHALDLGASGVIIPHVETLEEVRLAVSAARYPPVGRRGRAGVAGLNLYNPTRPIPEDIEHANRNVAFFLKVETESAILRLDELVEPEGVDGVMVGPLDLSIDVGLPGETRHPKILGLLDRVRETCVRRGLKFGDYVGSPEEVAGAVKAGASWVIVGSEMDLLRSGWKRAAAAARGQPA